MGRMWRAEKAVSRMGAMARAGAVNMDELSDAKGLLAHHHILFLAFFRIPFPFY